MLDELLGRAPLRARISELEEERHRLRERLDAEERRRSEAVTARQDAEERVNRLEDRVAELEDRVARATDGTDGAGGGDGTAAGPGFRRIETLRGRRLAVVLDRLAGVEAGPEGALTAMVEDSGDLPDAVADAFGDRAGLVRRAAPCLALADDAGLVSATIRPPVAPDPFVAWDEGFRLDREWFLPTGEFALALVRSDLFAIGEYDGDERIAFRGFESDVKADHSKGGFSQGRFERRRDAQIAEHLDRCRDAIDDRDADRLYVVGEHTLLGEFAEDAEAAASVDATGDPEDALDGAFRDFWAARLCCI